MDLALLIIAAKVFLKKEIDPCKGLKVGTQAHLNCLIEHGK